MTSGSVEEGIQYDADGLCLQLLPGARSDLPLSVIVNYTS